MKIDLVKHGLRRSDNEAEEFLDERTRVEFLIAVNCRVGNEMSPGDLVFVAYSDGFVASHGTPPGLLKLSPDGARELGRRLQAAADRANAEEEAHRKRHQVPVEDIQTPPVKAEDDS